MSTTIIAENFFNVNVYTEKTAHRIAIANIKRAKRKAEEKKPILAQWQDHKKLSVEMAERMLEAGLGKRGWNVMACGKEIEFTHCKECGNIHITSARLCRDRLCPICNWRLSIKRYSIMQNVIQALFLAYPEYHYSLVTLTVQNCKGYLLKETLEKMQETWKTLISQRWAKTALFGWGRSIETTFNEETQTHHPHYHVILISNTAETCDKVVNEWLRIAEKKGLTVSKKAQNREEIRTHTEGDSLAGAICEAYKYSVKATDAITMPLGELRNLALAIANKRLVSFGGIIKEYLKKLEINEDIDKEDDEEIEEIEVCTKCKSKELDHMVASWASNRYFVVPKDSFDLPEECMRKQCEELNAQIVSGEDAITDSYN